ncbi:MAG: HEPN domain-containing protein [Syntrophales bacterium LBB04]|nr:HEPN domain-containing protein [Syntrophales bacterium LBB04]
MVMHPGGGTRIPADGLVRGLLSSAILQMYFFRLQKDESTFVRTVLEGFEEVRRAAREKGIRAHSVTGIARVTLREGSQISTPWGVLGPAPPVRAHDVFPRYSLPRTTCTLAEPLDVLIKFDRAPSPMPFNAPESIATVSVLFPLSCALASKDSARPVVPLTTWWTLLVPFEGLSFGYSTPFPPFRMEAETDIADIGSDIEKWARMVHTAHAPSVDIAARRLVSAVASRSDTADSLVDAVMVWENLFGTRTEVNFRVTAALSKLLEADPAKRRSLRKELAKIYDIRSRVVHGERKLSSEIRGPCTRAIDVAVQALRACYERGRDWTDLSSEERADRILLEWQ